jgi:hypothetical protein
VGPQERVQDSNKILSLFLLVATLYIDEVLNAGALLLQHSIDEQESEGNKLGLTLDFLDNLKQQTDILLSAIFLFMP